MLWAWLRVEIVFSLVFRFYIVPRANRRVPPAPYRDYGEARDRYRIMLRVLERTEKFARYWGKPSRGVIATYIWSWFHDKDHVRAPSTKIAALAAAMAIGKGRKKTEEEKLLIKSAKHLSFHESKLVKENPNAEVRIVSNVVVDKSSKNPQDDHTHCHDDGDGMEHVIALPDNKWTVRGTTRGNISEFFAWTMFGRSLSEITNEKSLSWMLEELEMCFVLAEERLGIVFQDESDEQLRPYLVSLEEVYVLFKPLIFYIFFYLVKFVGDMILRSIGFRRVTTRSGVVAWYRPGTGNDKEIHPMLFFHGISPGGFTIYLPMLLNGFPADTRRGLVIFENPSISWVMSFKALTEQETVLGVRQVVDECFSKDQKFVLAGHSYGTCPLTWILKDPALKNRIGHLFLMDPVSLMLSEATIVRNFLYAEVKSEIFAMAATEVFTQYYCRRHFAWYNTELWLEDIPEEIPLSIVMGGLDEIVDAPSIRSHILMFHQENPDRAGNLKLVYGKNARHNACLMIPHKWRIMSKVLLEQEELMARSPTTAMSSKQE
jgi:pimeloyl-ACP methyl ester carboxylesterase